MTAMFDASEELIDFYADQCNDGEDDLPPSPQAIRHSADFIEAISPDRAAFARMVDNAILATADRPPRNKSGRRAHPTTSAERLARMAVHRQRYRERLAERKRLMKEGTEANLIELSLTQKFPRPIKEEQGVLYTPTEDEISAACAAIQATWSKAERQSRIVGAYRNPRVEIAEHSSSEMGPGKSHRATRIGSKG